MKIDVHDVEAHVAGAHFAEQGVEVGTVIVEQAARLVHKFGNLHYLGLKHSERVGIGHHDAGHRVIEQRLEILYINRAIRFRLHFHHLETRHHC